MPSNKISGVLLTATAVALALAVPAFAAPPRPQFRVTAYNIQADLDPAAGKLNAAAIVTFTALEDLTTPTFELNNGLVLTSVTDQKNASLTSERLTPQNVVRFTLATAHPQGHQHHLDLQLRRRPHG